MRTAPIPKPTSYPQDEMGLDTAWKNDKLYHHTIGGRAKIEKTSPVDHPLALHGREQGLIRQEKHVSLQVQYIAALHDMYVRSAYAVIPRDCH